LRWALFRPAGPLGTGTPGQLFEATDRTLILALLAAWGLNLAALAVFLHRYSSAAAYCLAGTIMVLLGAGALLKHRRRNQATIAGRGLLLLVLGHLAFLSAAAWLALAPTRGFIIDNFALYQVDPFADGTARFAALSELPDGQAFLSPIDALVLLKVRNGAAGAKRIRDYRVEAWTGSGWQPLCQVSFAPNPPYYLFSRERAREVALTPLAIKGPEEAIAPGQASTFWSGWSCPQKCDLAAIPLRLMITGPDARTEIVPFPSDHKSDGTALPSGLDIGGVLDLDGTKEKIYGRNSCARFARARRAGALW
jgi:hypothetical protein